jgi:hypothetical protein
MIKRSSNAVKLSAGSTIDAQIKKADLLAQPKLEDLHTAHPTKTWAELKALALTDTKIKKFYDEPIHKSNDFGKQNIKYQGIPSLQAAIARVIKDKGEDAPDKLTGKETYTELDTLLTNLKKGSTAFTDASNNSLSYELFNTDLRDDTSNLLETSFYNYYTTGLGSGASADPVLVAAVKSVGIIEFMNKMAAGAIVGGIDRAKLEVLWKVTVNSTWIKDRFRDAAPKGDGDSSLEGFHEWIPSNMIMAVINRAAGLEDGIDAGNWIEVQNVLRTKTMHVVFNPAKSSEMHSDGKGLLIQGHVGSVYLRTFDSSGDPEYSAETTGTNVFHNALRAAFTDSKTIATCIADLEKVAQEWVWRDGNTGGRTIHKDSMFKTGQGANNQVEIGNNSAIITSRLKAYTDAVDQIFTQVKAKY